MGDRRTGLFSALDCIGGLVFSHNERTNQYLFLFQIWKQLHQRAAGLCHAGESAAVDGAGG